MENEFTYLRFLGSEVHTRDVISVGKANAEYHGPRVNKEWTAGIRPHLHRILGDAHVQTALST